MGFNIVTSPWKCPLLYMLAQIKNLTGVVKTFDDLYKSSWKWMCIEDYGSVLIT